MARPLRIQFPGAIYHVMARGNGRQLLFYSDDDYQCMLELSAPRREGHPKRRPMLNSHG